MVCKKENFKPHTGTLAIALVIAASSMTVYAPVYAEPTKWSDNAFLKAVYFDRSIKQRALIVGGTVATVSITAYLLYKAMTRTPWEKNLIALEQIEQAVKKQYWHRVKTEEIDIKVPFPAFKSLLVSFAKSSKDLTLLTANEKLELFEHMVAAGNALHDMSVSREQLVKICEVEFYACIKKLREKIIEQQQQAERLKVIKPKVKQ